MVARGGSKGLPRKNLRQIDGHSLIAWKVASARQFMPNAHIVCSTDDREIMQECHRLDVETPFLRPAELASDTATTNDVISHALDFLSDDDCNPDAVFLLEPSSPFIEPRYYSEAVEMFTARNAALVAGMRETYPNRIFTHCVPPDESIRPFCETVNALADSRRQALPSEWTVNGSLYLFETAAFKKTKNIYGTPDRSYGLQMSRWSSIEIENATDLAEAEFAVQGGFVSWKRSTSPVVH